MELIIQGPPENIMFRNSFSRQNYWFFTKIIPYTQYPIIRNGDQRWALEFLKNYQFPDADRFLILQGWALAVS